MLKAAKDQVELEEIELKENLDRYVEPNKSISNGAITITNDGTTMKLINSAPSETVNQHATFTFAPKGT